MKYIFTLLLLIGGFTTFAQNAIDGNWKGTRETPNGTFEINYTFKVEGNELKGTWKTQFAEAFEKMYTSIYVPAMSVQQGYLESKLLRLYPDNAEKEIEGEATTYNYQIQISFDTEANRRKWVASEQHKIAWPAATSLAKSYKWRGYDVMGDDNHR